MFCLVVADSSNPSFGTRICGVFPVLPTYAQQKLRKQSVLYVIVAHVGGHKRVAQDTQPFHKHIHFLK
eukprot:5582534-Amphidinium_carterae.1